MEVKRKTQKRAVRAGKGSEGYNGGDFAGEMDAGEDGNVGENTRIRRILMHYTKLVNGEWFNKQAEASYYGVSEKTIQRDLDCIGRFLEQDASLLGDLRRIAYNREQKGYYLKGGKQKKTYK